MSVSLVRTCDKCGLRSEKRVLSDEDVQIATLWLSLMLAMPGAGEGCYDCTPEIEHKDDESRESWDRSVQLAYSHGPRPERRAS